MQYDRYLEIEKWQNYFQHRDKYNIENNKQLLGEKFEEDYLLYYQIKSSNKMTEVYRSYLSMVDIFSGIGGLHEFWVLIIV